MKLKGHSSRKHALFSPSASERWTLCPGSIALSKIAPPQKESVYAREGTRAHECLEFIVKRYHDLDNAVDAAFKKWPSAMVFHAKRTADLLFSDLLRPSPDAELLVETKVHMRSVKEVSGTLDYAWVDHFGTLTVIDYKYGAGVTVHTEDERGNPNPQLMIYAAGAAAKFGYDFERVRIVIVQPRVYDKDEIPIQSTYVSIPKLKEFELKIADAVEAALEPDAVQVPGEHCRWCPGLTICEANSKKALVQANIAFDIEADEGIEAMPVVPLLRNEDLPKLLDACDRLDFWIKAVRERSHQLAEDGVKIPGYKLVAKKAQTTWIETAEAAALKRFKLDAFKLEKKFLTPKQFLKSVGDEGIDFVKKYTLSISSGSHLVREDDKRSELVNTSLFDIEEDDDLDEWSW